jgi:hypothetical protein
MYEHLFQSSADLRVGDAEREAIAERLRTAHAEGRLDADELQDRIDRCLKAKTGRDLRSLVADLPEDAAREPRRGIERWPGGWLRLIPVVPLLLALIAFSAVQGHFFFPLLWLFFLARFVFGRGRYGLGRRHRGPIAPL